MSKPIARFVFREKETGKYMECGLLWPSKNEGYNPNFAPNKEASTSPDGTQEKIAMSDALGRVERGEGYINIHTQKGSLLDCVSQSDDDDF